MKALKIFRLGLNHWANAGRWERANGI